MVGSQFGFRKTEDISADIFHLKEYVEHVSSIIGKAYAVDVLEINPEYLLFPDLFGNMALTRVNFLIYFALIG